ncbi:hypothetical protein MNBD_GAMMA12-1205 [hydrothermal vent metagenome]|uniref:Serine protease n=1 Tax=hydrothermal vent metagenome TaxID=652676 RepID=A0A3B0YBS4_9ZZZZ
MKLQLRQYFSLITLFYVASGGVTLLYPSIGVSNSLFDDVNSGGSNNSSRNSNNRNTRRNSASRDKRYKNFPIKARVEVILPVYRGLSLRKSDLVFPVLKKIFTDVRLRGKIQHPHFSLFLRVETERRKSEVHIKMHIKFNTGTGDNVARISSQGSSGRSYSKSKAYDKAFSKAYARLLYKLVSNRSFKRIVRNGINNSITRKTNLRNLPKISSRYKQLNDSVATIRVLGLDGKGKAGSGFFVSKSGLMLTNHHVISKAKAIWVRLTNNKMYPAVVVAKDAWMDIALLKVKVRGNNFIPLDLYFNRYKIGDEVIAIGSPLSNEETISKGILSSVKNVSGYQVIQTDTAINRGNSGGPLIHLQSKKVIGINTIKRANGIAYAMSLQTIRNFIKENRQIIHVNAKGKVTITKRISFKGRHLSSANAFRQNRRPEVRRIPATRPRYVSRGRSFGITVYSDSVSRSTHSVSARKMAASISQIIETKLHQMSRDSDIKAKVFGSSARKFTYEGRSFKHSKKMCQKHRLDGVVNFFFGSGTGSFGAAEVEVSFYDCRANRKYHGLYNIRLSKDEVSPYSAQINTVLTKLLRKVRK